MAPCIRWLGRFVAKAPIVALVFVLALFGPGRVRVSGAVTTGSVSGFVRDSQGNGVGGLRVGILATGLPYAQTSSNGAYTLSFVPTSASPYDVHLLAPCTRDQVQRIVVDGAETLNFTVAAPDAPRAGYRCQVSSFSYVDGTAITGLTGDDEFDFFFGFPFGTMPYFGRSVSNFVVTTNGYLTFDTSPTFAFPGNVPLPQTDEPNGVIAPFWDDLVVDAEAVIRTGGGGVAPNRFFVLEWVNVAFFHAPPPRGPRVTFEVVLFENGRIVFNYKSVTGTTEQDSRTRGGSATVGIENFEGTAANQRSFNQPYLDNGFAIEFVPASK
jgi:hypothetical protein